MTVKGEKRSEEIIKSLQKIVGRECVTSEVTDLYAYTRDASPVEGVLPLAVVKPATTIECSRILKLANELKFKVYVRGGGTSAGGGGIAFQQDSIILDTTRMNKILEIDEKNMSVTVQAGIIWSTLNEELAKQGYRVPFWGPESAYGATLGGSLALASMSSQGVTEAGGTYNQVITLEVVLPTGDILRTGSDTLPNAGKFARVCNGGDYTGIFLGSLGVFGIITEVTLNLEALPNVARYIGVVFDTWDDGIDFVLKILRVKAIPKSLNITPGERSVRSSWNVDGQCGFRIVIEEADDELAERKERIIRKIGVELDGYFPEDGDKKVEEWWKKMFLRLVTAEKEYGFAAHACHKIPLHKLPIAVKEAEEYFIKTHRVEEQGMKMSLGAYVSDQRPVVGFYPFLFFKDYPEVRKKAMEIWEGWIAHAITYYGASPYWMGWVWTKNLMPRVRPEYIDFLKKLKSAIDPNNILNPGVLV
ncbi:MAG: FAD-binding oxidoreductase [Candidatus Aenigmarchaeota archaeon]|nr:FAD-binding oxidoreductase [Candidatus Aenigmarchaeota archaeon]